MTISLLVLDLYILNMKTRMPFRYGIAVMTALPCLFVRLTVAIDGQPVYGFSSDGLAPKWFTKDPESHYRDEIADMLRVVQQAFRHGQEMGGTDTIFALWRGIYDRQQRPQQWPLASPTICGPWNNCSGFVRHLGGKLHPKT